MKFVTFTTITLTMAFSPFALCQKPMIEPGTADWRELYDPPSSQPQEVASNNPLRKQLFDQLRFRLNSKIKSKLLFEGSLKAFKNWAVFVGNSVDDSGKPIKFPPMDNSDTAALWIRTKAGWQLVDYSSGHSDAFFPIWHERYGVPKELVGLGNPTNQK